jgi:hypothetical protein
MKSFKERLMSLFSEEQVAEQVIEATEVKAEFEDYRSGDIIIRTEGELAVDTMVFKVVVTEVETETVEVVEALEDGEYILHDGRTIIVVDGIVKEIIEAEVPVEETIEDIKEEIFSSFEILRNEIKSLKEELVKKETENEALKAEFSKEISEVKSEFERSLDEVKQLPATQGVIVKRSGFTLDKKEVNVDQFTDMAKKYLSK